MGKTKLKPVYKGKPKQKPSLFVPIAIGVLVLIAVLVVAFGQQPGQRSASNQTPQIEGLESFPSEGANHVAPGTRVDYKTDPPTSGAHYEAPVAPGFYDREMPAEALVHNLEHGHIVIYYDPERTPAEDIEKIRRLTEQYSDYWDAVVGVPRNDPEYPVILTAWTKMLRLKEWDEERVNAFVDAFRGRGPENPVR